MRRSWHGRGWESCPTAKRISKGTELTRSAAGDRCARWRRAINYIGYVEGRDINIGKVDVVVTDGFTGNVALKTMEGFAEFVFGCPRNIQRRPARSWLRCPYASAWRRCAGGSTNPKYGGAPLLGVNGVAIVAMVPPTRARSRMLRGGGRPGAVQAGERRDRRDALAQRLGVEHQAGRQRCPRDVYPDAREAESAQRSEGTREAAKRDALSRDAVANDASPAPETQA